jgi:hypothetical protein
MTDGQPHAGAGDFDFFFGSWRTVDERLKSRLSNSDEWEQSEAAVDCRPILGGLGNAETYRSTRHGRLIEGFSLRLFNSATGLWSIYWVDNIRGELFPPVVGKFEAGVGEFFGDDEHEGTDVLVRFRWSEITANSARWEQAFSTDGGQTWEVNWIARHTRRQLE